MLKRNLFNRPLEKEVIACHSKRILMAPLLLKMKRHKILFLGSIVYYCAENINWTIKMNKSTFQSPIYRVGRFRMLMEAVRFENFFQAGHQENQITQTLSRQEPLIIVDRCQLVEQFFVGVCWNVSISFSLFNSDASSLSLVNNSPSVGTAMVSSAGAARKPWNHEVSKSNKQHQQPKHCRAGMLIRQQPSSTMALPAILMKVVDVSCGKLLLFGLISLTTTTATTTLFCIKQISPTFQLDVIYIMTFIVYRVGVCVCLLISSMPSLGIGLLNSKCPRRKQSSDFAAAARHNLATGIFSCTEVRSTRTYFTHQ
ncbi:hypothetical protein T03_9711 [Trichinella britovi]|uniref:Uncharacterized protein n=1 Tax=Trichinella britovi TaxID=45882 RepID=A0A0V1CZP2_TRIBR|nr:hypothetical protein T03_9711 [Trichinella britovi]